MGAALPVISLVASGVGTVMSVVGQNNAAKASAAAANYNAQVNEQNARRAAQVGEIEANNASMRTRAAVGATLAGQAGKGVDVNSGSASDVQVSQSMLGELNALNIRSKAIQEAYNYKTTADLQKVTAKNDKKAGAIAATTTAVSGLGKFGSEYSDWVNSKSLTDTVHDSINDPAHTDFFG